MLWFSLMAMISSIATIGTFWHQEKEGDTFKNSIQFQRKPFLWGGAVVMAIMATGYSSIVMVNHNEAALQKKWGVKFSDSEVLTEGIHVVYPWEQTHYVSLSRNEAVVNFRGVFGTTGGKFKEKAGQVRLNVNVILPYRFKPGQSLAKMIAVMDNERAIHTLMTNAARAAVQNVALEHSTYSVDHTQRIVIIANEFQMVATQQFMDMGMTRQEVEEAISFIQPLVSEFKPGEKQES